MQIIYCETCGHRIPSEDIDAGRVTVDDYKYYCPNCVPRTDVQRPAGRSSRKIVPVTPPPATSATPVARRNSAIGITPLQRPPGDHQHSSHKHHPVPVARSIPVLPVAVGVGLFVLGAIAVFTLNGASPSPNKRNAISTPLAANSNPASTNSASHVSTVTPQRNPAEADPPRANGSIEPESKPGGAPAVNVDHEKEADDGLAAVLRWDGVPASNGAERIKRLDDFIERYSDSRAAARAQLMLSNLRSEVASGASEVPDTTRASAAPAESAPSAQSRAVADAAPQRGNDTTSVDDVPTAKKTVEPESKAGAPATSIITPASNGSSPERETAAAKAWAALLKVADIRDFKALDEGLKKFTEVNAGTHYLDDHGSEIHALSDYVKAAATVEKGMAGWWKLDEGTGTKAADSSGNGNHGALGGHPVWGRGKYGSALAFTTREDDVVIPNSPSLERVQEGDYTISAWVRPEDMPPTKDGCLLTYTIFAKPGWHEGLFYDRSGTFVSTHVLGNNTQWCSTFHVYAPNVMHHVAATVTRSAGVSHIYVDGLLDGSLTWNANENPRDYGQETWRIGQAQAGHKLFAYPFRGMIDDVRLYNRVLTPAEIAVIAELPFKKFYLPESPATARFAGIDESTRGNWKGQYGALGHLIPADTHFAPANVQFNQSGGNLCVFAATTRDPRGLQRNGDNERVAGCWYSDSSVTIEFNFTDGRTHFVSLYCCDWDSQGRSAKFESVDVNGTVLDTRELPEYVKGKYLNWEIKGHVKIVAHPTKSNVVINGIFFNQ